jgi:RNA polymerase sigma factor (sigma-70 family)
MVGTEGGDRDGASVPVGAAVRPAVDHVAEAYRQHGPELVRFAGGIVGAHDAADVVATAVARTWSRSQKIEIQDGRAYLFRAVYRESISWRRQRGRRASLQQRAESGRHEPAPAPDRVDPVDPAIAAALQSLSARQRAVIVLTYWQDLHPDQIAALLDISPGAVRKHLARARAALREALS